MNDITKTNEYNDEIRSWFSSERNFDKGFSLFVRFSHNKALAIQLARKRTQSKLEYELGKILERNIIIERPVLPITTLVKADVEINTDLSGIDQEKEKNIVVKRSKIDYESLTAEQKELYDTYRKLNKELRSWHEKMKIATTDEQRKEFREQVEMVDERIRENWKIFDGSFSEKKESEEVKEQDPIRMVANSRSYISKQLFKIDSLKGSKLEKAKEKLRINYQIIIDSHQALSSETIEKFKKHGIIVE